MGYSADQLREWYKQADSGPVYLTNTEAREIMLGLADLIERHAKLEKHAEDMAKCLDSSIAVDQSPEGELSFRDEWSYNVDQLVHAYRADFPKEG